MKSLDRFKICVVLLAGFVALAGWVAPAWGDRAAMFAAPAEMKVVATEQFPAVSLRGYGTVSGTLWKLTVDGKSAAALQIDCESAAKAAITHAKYISDLNSLPGVKAAEVNTPAGKIGAWTIDRQGSVAAILDGDRVLILAASSDDVLGVMYARGVKTTSKQPAFAPTAAVPMYLDRWDKYGFRFYHRTYETPKDQNEQTYDFTSEFDFAKDNGDIGLITWAWISPIDTAEGQMMEPWWDWTALETKARGLPLGINLNFNGQLWLANRHRDQMAMKMPQYCGGQASVASPGFGGEGWTSWSSTVAKDASLSQLQQLVRKYNSWPNVVSWLEPHGELPSGNHDLLNEYGPLADGTYREFLKGKYGTPEVVAARWGDDRIKSWDDVRVPELASFLGWGPGALDLTGRWKVLYQDEVKPPATYPPFDGKWFDPAFDDSQAPSIAMPGNDRMMLLPRRPAVFRRTFDVDAAWKKNSPKIYLYVWDLNGHLSGDLHGMENVLVDLNGKRVATSRIVHAVPHWVAVDVTETLKEGKNLLAVGVPQGFVAYRVYLSPHAPAEYPNLGEGKNAQWVDFMGWYAHTRLDAVRRGVEMIRQVDPQRQIELMAPDAFTSGVKKLAEGFGGSFHNTGYMAAFWADDLGMLMNSSRLPMSAEPGGPAGNLSEYKQFIARWLTEGVQGIDYFIHIGNVMWNSEIRGEFERTRNLIRLTGKFNIPQAQTALFFSDGSTLLTGFPWGEDQNSEVYRAFWQGGYWRWNLGEYLRPTFLRDAVNDHDFLNGNVNRYRVIIDTNSAILDDDLISAIESYVRQGGIFVTFVQTGRCTPTKFDAWPISRLTGYEVTAIDPHQDGQPIAWHKVKLAPGQNVLSDFWKDEQNANGLKLKKAAADAKDLMLWDDGSVAVGVRPLGRGFIVHAGAKFCGDRIHNGGTELTTRFFADILDHYKVPRLPASVTGNAVMLRHFVSNNGLYDVWMAANFSDKPVTTDVTFAKGIYPAFCIDVQSGQRVKIAVDGTVSAIKDLKFDAFDTRAFLTPKKTIDIAPRDWFVLQRDWWRGTQKPAGQPLASPEMKLARSLTDDWAFRPIRSDKDFAPAMTAPGYDDSKWERMRLGMWNAPKHWDVRRAVFRKTFTVPAEWSKGRVTLWMLSFFNTTFLDRAKVYLDGKPVKESADGLAGDDFGGALKPGSTHTVAVEIAGKGKVNGTRGDTWLYYRPDAVSTMDLGGEWSASVDAMRYDTSLKLPGEWNAYTARRSVTIDAAQSAGKNVVLHVETSGPVGVIVNGHMVRKNLHPQVPEYDLNITPWIHRGEINELELFSRDGRQKADVKNVRLDFFDPAVFP